MPLRILLYIFSDTESRLDYVPCERSLIQMDKSKVIEAYKRGFLTIRECGQILGMEERQLQRLLAIEESKADFHPPSRRIGG